MINYMLNGKVMIVHSITRLIKKDLINWNFVESNYIV